MLIGLLALLEILIATATPATVHAPPSPISALYAPAQLSWFAPVVYGTSARAPGFGYGGGPRRIAVAAPADRNRRQFCQLLLSDSSRSTPGQPEHYPEWPTWIPISSRGCGSVLHLPLV